MNILFVNACARRASRTKLLAEYLLSKLEGTVHERNLSTTALLPLSEETLTRRTSLSTKRDFTDPLFALAKEFAAADSIVIAAPFWDLSFPSLLKLYIEHIHIVGVTFAYHADGKPYGLCKAKKLYYVTTAGGPIVNEVYGYGYIQALAKNFYGILDTYCIKAENVDVNGANVENILLHAKQEIDTLI